MRATIIDGSVITAEDAQSVDGILAAAAAAGRTFDMTLNDGWYIYSFFAGAGLTATLADDGEGCRDGRSRGRPS